MTEAPISPLRRRMIEDMTIGEFAPRTQKGYIRAVKGFSAFLGASPDRASFEDLRRYQLRLVASGAGSPTINHTVTALRFLFIVTLRKPQVVIRLLFIREPRNHGTLPSIALGLGRHRTGSGKRLRPLLPILVESMERHPSDAHGIDAADAEMALDCRRLL